MSDPATFSHVRGVIRRYTAALSSANGGGACRLMTDAGQRQVAADAASTGRVTCAQAEADLGKFLRYSKLTAIGAVSVRADSATTTASYSAPGQPVRYRLARRRGRWLIDGTRFVGGFNSP
jgi:hypothetical protein